MYLEILEEERAVGCMTLIDPEIPVLGQLEQAVYERDARVLHPERTSALLCEDKMSFFETMERAGVPAVPTQLSPLDAPPFIRKHRTGSAASGFHVFRDGDDPLLTAGRHEPAEYVYQPFCTGQHLCVDAYFSIASGRLIDLCAKEVLNKANGESYLLRSVAADRFVEIVTAVAEAIPLRGIVNLDIYDDGELRVMEVNCRVGGNYPASHAFGCNLLRRLVDGVADGDTVDRLDMSTVSLGVHVAKYFEFSPAFSLPDDNGERSDGAGPDI